MKEFFTTMQGAWDDGSVRMKAVGIAIIIAIIIALIVIAAITKKKNGTPRRRKELTAKQMAFCAIAIALAVVCSMIKFAALPMGGSVTLFSMLFITLIGYWYGPKVGIMTAAAYGLTQFVMEPIFYTLPQLLLDYPLAFGALGISGFFAGRKHGLVAGYCAGVLGRYIFAVISGVVFFASYAPKGTPALVYSLGYNATYLLPEAIVTVILLSIPAVRKAMDSVRQNALS